MNVLMVGVDKNRKGGMWTVSEMFLKNTKYNTNTNLYYVATSTGGSIIKRILKMFQGYIKIYLILLCKDVDIIHIHMAEKGSVCRKGFVVRIGKIFKKKVVIQMHAGPFMDWYNTLPKKKQQQIKNMLLKADKIIVLGEYWKNQLKKIIISNKISVVYNGALCPEYRKYNKYGNYIVFLGMIRREKGIYDLLDAIQIIDSKLDSKIKILLCGVDVEGDILSIISKKGLKNRVKMLGWVSNEQREKIFMKTQLCVLPTYTEALSMVVIESMCYGIPIITTNITTMPELVGNNIRLVEPGNVKQLSDTIWYYSKNEKDREKASIGLYNRASKMFTIDIMVDKILQIYNSLLMREER